MGLQDRHGGHDINRTRILVDVLRDKLLGFVAAHFTAADETEQDGLTDVISHFLLMQKAQENAASAKVAAGL